MKLEQFAKWLDSTFEAIDAVDLAATVKEAERHSLKLGAGDILPPVAIDRRSTLAYLGKLLAWCRSQADADYLIDVKQAVARLGCSPRKLAGMTKAGEIPTVRIGRRVLFSSQALDRWIYAIST